MASVPVVLAAALGAAFFFTFLGTAVARLTGAWTGAMSVAPALGWAVFVALALPIQLLVGFSSVSTAVLAALAFAVAVAVLARVRGELEGRRLPWWAFALAAVVAVPPLAGLLPKTTEAGVLLGPAASDHVKVAMIDAMTRLGLPAANPFFGLHGERGVLSYYYLWHFGAAQLSLLTGISGWEADAAMTGVTAFASVILMMGLAARCNAAFAGTSPGRNPTSGPAIALVAMLALTGGLRPLLGATFGWDAVNRLFANYRDLEGWMAQACWVPQHLAAANSVVLVVLLLPAFATRRWAIPVTGIVAAAAFGSSAWIGGVTLAVIAVGVAGTILWRASAAERRRFIARAVIAAVITAVVAFPLLLAELGPLAVRHVGSPIAWHPYEVLGAWLSPGVRRALDLPAFWLVLLPIDLPAVYPAGVAAFFAYWRVAPLREPRIADLGVATLLGLSVSWLLASTIGNNDLGWRAVLPATLVLLPLAAAGIAHWFDCRALLAAGLAVALIAVSIPERVAVGNVVGRPSDDAGDFASSPALWSAVRRYAGPADRVASNPLFLDDLTSFPVNISWGLLANRSSCYSGWETAQVYVDLPKSQVRALDDRFIRVFAGKGGPDDIRALAADYGCHVAVVTDADGAWVRDPFAASRLFRLAERADGWRIYVRR